MRHRLRSRPMNDVGSIGTTMLFLALFIPLGVGAQTSSDTLDIATWNLWRFGNSGAGAGDEDAQLAGIADVIGSSGIEIWALQEIDSEEAFDSLIDALPDWYRGKAHPDSGYKVALVFDSRVIDLKSYNVVLSHHENVFSGRRPMRFTIEIHERQELVIVVLHATANSWARPDTVSWARRVVAADALQSYLATHYDDRPVVVLGDWNDELDSTSITQGLGTPYHDFLRDHDWTYVTAGLSGSYPDPEYNSMLDHILLSNEAMAWYVDGSAKVLSGLFDYEKREVSDHLPVTARLVIP